LTNLGTALQSNHEDAEHPKHCIEKTCLMFWSAEIGGGIGNMVSSGSAPQLDANVLQIFVPMVGNKNIIRLIKTG
jgi:hypothetical protein